MRKEGSAEKVVQDSRRKTRRRFSVEEKIRIVLEGLRGEESIATLCRKEGLAPNLYDRWSKEFLEAGKRRLVGDRVTGQFQFTTDGHDVYPPAVEEHFGADIDFAQFVKNYLPTRTDGPDWFRPSAKLEWCQPLPSESRGIPNWPVSRPVTSSGRT